MNDGFLAFKKRMMKEHLMKTLIVSLSTGLSVFGVLFILYKRDIISIKLWLIILITILSIIIPFLIVYLIFKPNDKKIAYRLDHTFGLNEKVQTMLDFKDENENGIVVLQRENTNHLLNSIKPKSLKYRIHFIFYIVLAIGLALTITSVSIPSKDTQIDEPPIVVSETDIDKIKRLIKHVEASNIYPDMKTKYIGELNLLITELQADILTEDGIKAYVEACINNTLYLMRVRNTNLKFGRALFDVEEKFYEPTVKNVQTDFIGTWIEKNNKDHIVRITKNKITHLGSDYAVEAYSNSTLKGTVTASGVTKTVDLVMNSDGTISDGKYTYNKYEDFYRLRALGEGIYNYAIDDIEKVISNTNEEYASKESIVLLKDKFNLDLAEFKKVLENNPENDELYTEINKFYQALEKVNSVSDIKKLEAITKAYDTLYSALAVVIPDMLNNRNEAWYIEDTLRDIFDLPQAQREEDLSKGGNNTGSDPTHTNDDLANGGGYGDGEYIFAAKDLFFDYDTGKWVAYGVFYNDYYSIVDSLIQDGTITEEMAVYVKDYFNKLLNGLNNKTEIGD